jgi:hypothetical protein
MRSDRWRAARRHQRRSATRHRFTYRELPVVLHPCSRASFTPPRLHGAMTEHAYRSPCRVFNGSFAQNIAAPPTVAASRKRSFGPRV